jgi:hypothetical protein
VARDLRIRANTAFAPSWLLGRLWWDVFPDAARRFIQSVEDSTICPTASALKKRYGHSYSNVDNMIWWNNHE